MSRILSQKLDRIVAARRRLIVFGILASVLALASVSIAQDRIEDLAAEVANGSIEIKRDALLRIRNLKSEAAARAAIPGLSDKDPRVRASAAQAMRFIPGPEAAMLLRPLLADKDPFVRRETAYALENSAAEILVPELTRLMFNDKAIEVKSAAAMALGGSRSPAVVGELTRLLAKKPDEDEGFLRRMAAHSIGRIAEQIRGARPTTTTPENFLDDKYKTIEPGTSTPLPAEFSVAGTLLLKILVSPDEENDTRREAAFALGAMGDPKVKTALRACRKDNDNYLGEICKEALLKLEKND